jgi:hypothetical protein
MYKKIVIIKNNLAYQLAFWMENNNINSGLPSIYVPRKKEMLLYEKTTNYFTFEKLLLFQKKYRKVFHEKHFN